MNNPERIKELGKGYHPVLIISNDEQNEYDDKVVAVPITTEDVEKVKLLHLFNFNARFSQNRNPSNV